MDGWRGAADAPRERGFVHLLLIVVLAALAIAPHFYHFEFIPPETAFEEESPSSYNTAGMRRPDQAGPMDVTVFVVGEVQRPGSITESGPLTVVDVLARATPLASASWTATLVRPFHAHAVGPTLPGAPDALTAPVDRYDTRTLHDGDTIYVPRARSFFVLGEVRYPGAYVLEPGTTVARAIALAGGVTGRGSLREISVSRVVRDKQQQREAKVTDPVLANDVIRVGSRLF